MPTPFKITEVPSLDPDRTKVEDNDDDVMKFYDIVINTNKGTLVLDMRNSSNGYYSGWVQLSEAKPMDQYSDSIEDADKDMRALNKDF